MDLDSWSRTWLALSAAVGVIGLAIALLWGFRSFLLRSQKLPFPIVSVEDGGMDNRTAVEHGYATVWRDPLLTSLALCCPFLYS